MEDLGTPVTVGLLRMQSAAEGEAKGPRPPADTRLTSPEQAHVAPRGGGTSEGTPDPPPGMVLHVRGGVRPPPPDGAACRGGGQTPPPPAAACVAKILTVLMGFSGVLGVLQGGVEGNFWGGTPPPPCSCMSGRGPDPPPRMVLHVREGSRPPPPPPAAPSDVPPSLGATCACSRNAPIT